MATVECTRSVPVGAGHHLEPLPFSNDGGMPARGLAPRDQALKRSFDVVASAVGLILTGWVILLAFVAASLDTRSCGFFLQERVGANARRFPLVKIRTMRSTCEFTTNCTTANDPRITRLGRILRKTKVDELPQLLNVLVGDMSMVGPRPDVPELVDGLQGEDRRLLSVRPGITGPASLKYRNEERLLCEQTDPERYSAEVIFPDKVRLNIDYINNYSFRADIEYIARTLI